MRSANHTGWLPDLASRANTAPDPQRGAHNDHQWRLSDRRIRGPASTIRQTAGRGLVADRCASIREGDLMSTDKKISRRTWLGVAAGVSIGVVSPVLLASAAEAKANKADVHYRDTPSGMRMCHMCKFFTSGGGGRSEMRGCMMAGGMMSAGSCELVEGRISPMGYCDLYAPLGA